MDFTIRRMETGDYAEFDRMMQGLHAVHVAARPDIYRDVPHVYSEEDFKNKMLDSEKFYSIFALDGEKPIGMCVAEKRTRSMMVDMTTYYLNAIYVYEEYRRMGVAKMLFENVKKYAEANGAERIDLLVWDFNESARRFYESLGFITQCSVLEMKL